MKLSIAIFALLLPSTAAAQAPPRAAVIAAATDIIQKAHYCTFITIGEDGQPRARMVDPIVPGPDFAIWFATNPLTRKVDQVRRNPRVTMSCFDAATSSYITVLGRGELVADVAEKQRHWKPDWAAIYPKGAKGNDFMLIRIAPTPRGRERLARNGRQSEDVAAAVDRFSFEPSVTVSRARDQSDPSRQGSKCPRPRQIATRKVTRRLA